MGNSTQTIQITNGSHSSQGEYRWRLIISNFLASAKSFRSKTEECAIVEEDEEDFDEIEDLDAFEVEQAGYKLITMEEMF